MAALEAQYMAILKKVLAERFVPSLPPLLDNSGPPANQQMKQLSRAFSAFALHKMLGITPQLASASVVDDINDKGIDAIFYDTTSETLYLLQAKLKESEQFKQEDALPFCEGIRLLLRQNFAQFNVNVQNRQTEIESAIEHCSRIQLVIPYTGEGVSRTASEAIQSFINDEDLDEERLQNQVEYYSAAEITRDLLAEQAYQPVHTEISLQKYHKVETPRTTYFGVARLSDLVALHDTEGKALYERNIRYYLGSDKSDVNKAIKTTLRDDPGSFFYLNNGVTAVCDEIEVKGKNPTSGFRKFKIRGLSIINGAQTVASAADFVAHNEGRDISGAKVLLTLIKAPADGVFGKKVTKARNYQNPVQVTNFASLDENQERLRQEIGLLGYQYYYRPESVATGDDSVTINDAIKALASVQNDPRFTFWLKSDTGRLADPDSIEYQMLFPTTLTGSALVNAILCYRAIRSVVVGYHQRTRGLEKLVYLHAAQIITTVMMKRLRNCIRTEHVIDATMLLTLISAPLDQLRQETFDLSQQQLADNGPMVYFRNQGNVVNFLADLMVTHFSLAADPAIANLRNIQSATETYPRQRLFDYLSNRAPQL